MRKIKQLQKRRLQQKTTTGIKMGIMVKRIGTKKQEFLSEEG